MFLATAACTVCIPALWALNSCAAVAGAPAGKTVGASDGGGAQSPADAHCPLTPLLDWAQSILLFGARGFSLAFNQALSVRHFWRSPARTHTTRDPICAPFCFGSLF